MLLSTNTVKWVWPSRSNVESYKMMFRLHGVDLVIKRNKKHQRCNKYWKDYDDWVLKLHTIETGCNKPYQEQDKNMPVCNTQKDIIRSKFYQTVVKRRTYTKPCKTLENIRWEYVEYKYLTNAIGNNTGEFWFGLSFPLETFKEVTQVR